MTHVDKVTHPAKYSDVLLPIFSELLKESKLVLDPFGGVGKLKQIRPDAIINEIEFEWAKEASGICGDALRLPFVDGTFDAICTSPTYGNRMADKYNPTERWSHVGYAHSLKRDLHPQSSGKLQWGETYREFHRLAWKECIRTLKNGGLFILNISNHIRKGKEITVSEWHFGYLIGLKLKYDKSYEINTPRMKKGENRDLRLQNEYIITFRRYK